VGLLLRVVVNALALGAAAWLLDDIRVDSASTGRQVVTLLVVGLIFGLVNAIVRPVVKLLSLPFIVLTLGLLLLVINALMLMLTSRLAQGLDFAFEVEGFGTAVLGSVIITVVSALLNAVLPDD
jgi:putative membrane protein